MLVTCENIGLVFIEWLQNTMTEEQRLELCALLDCNEESTP
jgi:hypothetical protein